MGRLFALTMGTALGLAAVAALPTLVHANPEAPAGAASSTVTYDVAPQPAGHGRLSQGWGLFATLSGRSMDIGARDFQWSEDPSVQRHDVEAGYGWRSGRTTAVIGYEDHDFGQTEQTTAQERQDRNVHRFNGGSGVLGLSLVLHGP
jgi:hypothetical protein